MSRLMIEAVRARLLELIAADVGTEGSPFAEVHPGARSTEIDFVSALHGSKGDGLIGINVRERRPGT